MSAPLEQLIGRPAVTDAEIKHEIIRLYDEEAARHPDGFDPEVAEAAIHPDVVELLRRRNEYVAAQLSEHRTAGN